MLIEDDIHFIYEPQQPTSSTTCTSWHMCTGLMDIQPSISAIPRPANCQKLHRIVPVVSKTGAVKQCRGGMSTGAELIEGNGYEARQTSKGELFVKVFGMSRDFEGAHIEFKMVASM